MAPSTQLPDALARELPLVRNGKPVGAQLEEKLATLVSGGELKPGEQLPSVRRLAEAAGVNVNTVRSVYARLEQRGLLTSEHGRGTFVRGAAGAPAAGGEDREYRRELMRQIGELERQLAYYTRHRIVGAPEPPPRKPASQLLPAAELIGVRDELDAHVQRLRAAEEDRLRLISAEKAELEAQELAERAAEIQAAGRRSRAAAREPSRRGTAASPPHVVVGPGAWLLKWRG